MSKNYKRQSNKDVLDYIRQLSLGIIPLILTGIVYWCIHVEAKIQALEIEMAVLKAKLHIDN